MTEGSETKEGKPRELEGVGRALVGKGPALLAHVRCMLMAGAPKPAREQARELPRLQRVDRKAVIQILLGKSERQRQI